MALALACAGLAAPAAAQTRATDPDLAALIPDSAIADPQRWASDTDAAHHPTPAPEAVLAAADPRAELPALDRLTLDWPELAEPPALAELTPEPGLAPLAPPEAAFAVGAPTVKPGSAPGTATAAGAAPAAPPVAVTVLGRDVELGFAGGDFPERGAFAARFAALSSLVTLAGKADTPAQVARRAEADAALLQRLLRLYGYYDPEVQRTIIPRGDNPAAGGVVRFVIQPGIAYRLGTIALGDLAATGVDYPALRAAYPLQPGERIDDDRIEAADAALLHVLGEAGYALAAVGEPELTIDHALRRGDLAVPVANGGKYLLGQVTSARPAFLSSDHLARMARLRHGGLARKSGIDDLRQAVLASGLVSAVTVTPRVARSPTAGAPGVLDLDVAMTPAPLRTIAGQLGYSSGQGFRLEASWEHRNLIPSEGMVRVRGVLGTREQLGGITFRRNNYRTRDQVLTADLYAQTVKYDAYTAKTVAFSASLQRNSTLLFRKPWVYSAGVEAIATRETEGSTSGVQSAPRTYFIGALPLMGGYDGSDDLLDPHRGMRAALRVSPEISVSQGNRANYLKAQFDLSGYQPLGARVVFAARARLGTIQGAALAAIAPSRRFYAGGGGSVRGYGYQQIGPKDAAGQPSGGRSLAEVSLEARIRTGLMGGAVSLVPFLDAGAADHTVAPNFHLVRAGAGLGLRYLTAFGPIRVDVGTPLNPGPNDSRIGVYVALGQAF